MQVKQYSKMWGAMIENGWLEWGTNIYGVSYMKRPKKGGTVARA